MPRYDYQCEECGEIYEVRATIKEKEAGLVLTCPKYSSSAALTSVVAISIHIATTNTFFVLFMVVFLLCVFSYVGIMRGA